MRTALEDVMKGVPSEIFDGGNKEIIWLNAF
jgi:hypothetical protein